MDDFEDSDGTYSSYSFSYSYYGNQTVEDEVQMLAIPIVFAIITVVGLIGNACVVIVILRNKHMQTVTNYFIMNNAITDMVFLIICVPITGSQYLIDDWIYGAFMCKLVVYMQYVSVQASCATLMAMTIDRYRVILFPMQSLHTRTVWRTTSINISIWIASFLLHVPIAKFYRVVYYPGSNLRFCTSLFKTINGTVIYEIYALITMYVLPFAVMFFCYGRILQRVWTSRRQFASSSVNMLRRRRWKVTRMTLLVVILFGVCWGPIHTLHLVTLLRKDQSIHIYFTAFFLCLSYSNSALNPFIYAFSGRRYRTLLVKSLMRRRERPMIGTPTPSRVTRTEPNNFTLELMKLNENGHSPRLRNGSNHYSVLDRKISQNVGKYV